MPSVLLQIVQQLWDYPDSCPDASAEPIYDTPANNLETNIRV
jgi:hypothetical protein